MVTANGPSTRFIDANLEMEVTPHVTTDGSILINIQAKQNQLSDRVDSFGVPGISCGKCKARIETGLLRPRPRVLGTDLAGTVAAVAGH